jgi:RNase P/RNase MRP subunit POP5
LTVRDRVGRTRYIGFVVESNQRVGRDELSRALAESARMLGGDFSYQLTAFEGGRGILRVPHRLKLDSILMLTSIRAVGRDRAPVRIRTVVTSGTICTVKERLGIPPSKRPPRDARRGPQGRGR